LRWLMRNVILLLLRKAQAQVTACLFAGQVDVAVNSALNSIVQVGLRSCAPYRGCLDMAKKGINSQNVVSRN
jgi:hypothetical protein